MEKYAFEIVEDVLEKFARSYNAKRNKQYWRMTKEIHGGTDKAVENITKGRQGNRSFKEMDERAQALAKKTTPLSTNKAMSNEIPVDDIPVNDGNQAKKKSGKSMLAGLGIAGAGAGIGSSVRKAIKSKDAAKAQEKLKKKMALGAGVGVAGALGAGAAYKHNSRDKAAFEIVNDILSK